MISPLKRPFLNDAETLLNDSDMQKISSAKPFGAKNDSLDMQGLIKTIKKYAKINKRTRSFDQDFKKMTRKKMVNKMIEEIKSKISSCQERKKQSNIQQDQGRFIKDIDMIEISKLGHVSINRARLHNWFVEVCSVYKQTWNTLWTAIIFLDKIIVQKGNISVENIHLYGITVLFMASKYHQNYQNRIKIRDIEKKIVHNKFTKQEILDCESEIFLWACQDISTRTIHFPTIQDFIIHQNADNLKEYKIRQIMIELFYFWQHPKVALGTLPMMTLGTLVSLVSQSILKKERFSNCAFVEEYFEKEYDCKNIKLQSLKLRI